MRHLCGTACFVFFLLFGILLYLLELGLQAWVAACLYSHGLFVWLALLLGFIIVPLLTSQLLSCQWAWPGPGTGPDAQKTGTFSRCLLILPHLVGVAVPWRYFRLILTCGILDTKKELAQVCLLRVFLTFTSSLPILLIETYILLEGSTPPGGLHTASGKPSTSTTSISTISTTDPEKYAFYSAVGVTLFNVCWSLATHRKRTKDYHFLSTLISWPGTVFRMTWRFGELTSRLLILALFAGMYSFWILLVLALHWLTMFTWCLTEEVIHQSATVTNKVGSGGALSAKGLKRSLVSSYVHMFCYLNLSGRPSRIRMVLFYVLMCLENAVLLVLWFLYDARTFLHVTIAVVVGTSCVFALISAVLYYNCFHVKSALVMQRGAEVMYMQPCMAFDCCPTKADRQMASHGGNFHPAWWIEVKENVDGHPATHDGLLPSELHEKTSADWTQLQQQQKVAYAVSGDHSLNSPEQRYWMDVRSVQTDVSVSSAMYESLSRYHKQLEEEEAESQERRKSGSKTSKSKRGSGVQYSSASKGGHDNDGLTWDDYNIQVLSSGHRTTCIDQLCRGECFPSQRPVHISDSGISATTSDQSGSRQRSDGSQLYMSDTSDFTSTRTSLSYLDPARAHHMSMYSDDWSLTSSSYGRTSSDSARDLGLGVYLPMLTHLNTAAAATAEYRSAAPLPPGAGLVVNGGDAHLNHQVALTATPTPTTAAVTTMTTTTTTNPEVHYDHVPSNLSQISSGERRRRPPRMGRASYKTHHSAHRRHPGGTGSRRRWRRAVPCGVAGKLHRRRHSDVSDVRSPASHAPSTTDSYDGSLSDWDPSVSDQASCAQLPGTLSDLDFSVCGEYPFTETETENEYLAPTPRQEGPAGSVGPATSAGQTQQLPRVVRTLDECGKQIGFAC